MITAHLTSDISLLETEAMINKLLLAYLGMKANYLEISDQKDDHGELFGEIDMQLYETIWHWSNNNGLEMPDNLVIRRLVPFVPSGEPLR